MPTPELSWQAQQQLEIAKGLKDAERYRKLSVLIESGEWFAGFGETIDSMGSTDNTYIDDKADLDNRLDSDEVTQSAKSWEIALANGT